MLTSSAALFELTRQSRRPLIRESSVMSDSVAEPSVGVSTRVALYSKLSLVAVVACLLAACDGPPPTSRWYADNPTQMHETQEACKRSAYWPSTERCDNAREAYSIWMAEERKREEERALAIARDTPEDLKTIDWYENHRHARRVKLRECQHRMIREDLTIDHTCLKAARAETSQFQKFGSLRPIVGARLSHIVGPHPTDVSRPSSPPSATPNPQRD
ncbi:hypothetical protein SAMN04487857_1112 [Pseudomonas sp. ok272]|uniref:EexN family lipoprotein n=1 Tax=unclassified Pseudomonas TaxID=196821 RepID=UPI0008C42E4F|nr:hypothetical protein SAMN04487857_1112 [Pseudomonas sp. ok272]SFN08622.1 hypothetical protein SAMN04487858_1122 [Pseudomonas sp. ok602]